MAILCQFEGRWYLAHFGEGIRDRCSLSVGANMPRGADFIPVNNAFGRQLESLRGVTLFPELRYSEIRVYPWHWDKEAREPMLYCLVQPDEVVKAIGLNPAYDEFIDRMKRDENWEWDVREGGGRAFHVDELEKIEGPPPEGAF